MKNLIWLLVSAAVLGTAAGPLAGFQVRSSSARGGDDSSGTGPYSLSGIVVDSLTGAPIRRALVQLESGTQPRLALTDEGGKFRFENLAQGQAGISAVKPGYADRAESDQNLAHAVITIGADTSPLVLKLEPQSAITVEVTGEDGEAAEGLPVRVLGSQILMGRHHWVTYGGGQTDEQGEFRVGNLRPGKYYLSVGPSFRPVGNTGEGGTGTDVGYPRVFYPNAADLERAAVVELIPGKPMRVEFALRTAPLYRISGAVAGGQSCSVGLADGSGEQVPIGMRVNPTTGAFRSGEIPAGSYTLNANCASDEENALMGRLPLRVDSNLTNVTVAVAPLVSIQVAFRSDMSGENGNDDKPTGMVTLTRNQARGHGATVWSQPESDEDRRRMVVKGVEPGAYSVDIRTFGPWYVESARSGSIDLVTGDLTVPEGGGATEEIEVTLRNDGASLSGNVHGGSGGTPATGMVLLVPGRAPRLTQVTRITNGTFAIHALAPGSYRVFALDRADDLEYTNPDALRDYLAKAQEVTLGSKQEARVDLELLRREK